jgi:hypothetical protein
MAAATITPRHGVAIVHASAVGPVTDAGGPYCRQLQICTIELILKLEPGGFSPMRTTLALVK